MYQNVFQNDFLHSSGRNIWGSEIMNFKVLLRGKTKVKLEIPLLCMGYNINKLHAKIWKESYGKWILSGFFHI
jgi:hypothetical protein